MKTASSPRGTWRRLFTPGALAALALGAAGCGAPLEEEQELAEAQVESTHQAATATYTLSWPDNRSTGDCRFGDTSLNHQPATNTRASGRLEQSLTISGLSGRRITALQLSGSSTTFKYDDVMLLAYNQQLVMASDRRVAQYSANTTTLGTSPVRYVWGNILNKLIDNQNIQSPWCTSGASTCTVPRTETLGSMSVNIPSFKAVDEAAYSVAASTRTFRLVTIGDNDPAIDCRHGPVTLTLTVTHEPAVEKCDGLDNDLDGLVDEAAGCLQGIHRSFNGTNSFHLYTPNLTEAQSNGYVLERANFFYLSKTQVPGTTPFYRCNGAPGTAWAGLFFFTGDPNCELMNTRYAYSIGNIAPSQLPGTVPLYRAFSPPTGNHFYTTSLAEYNGLASPGWSREGLAGYVWPSP